MAYHVGLRKGALLRIDTVHQGDQDGRKGLYHINAVDQVTQWEIVAATPHISELWLVPVLEALDRGDLDRWIEANKV